MVQCGLICLDYELIPALVFSILTAYIVSKLTGGPDKETLDNFQNYRASIKGTQHIQGKTLEQ
jgi:hypothetical protein